MKSSPNALHAAPGGNGRSRPPLAEVPGGTEPATQVAAPVAALSPSPADRLSRALHWAVERAIALRVYLLAAGHFTVFVLVYWAAFLLRFDFRIPPNAWDTFWQTVPWVVAVKMIVFYALGHYHGWWRYVTFADLAALLRASLVAGLVVFLVDRFLLPTHIPRSVLLLDLLGGIIALGTIRSSWRMFHEQVRPAFQRNGHRYALLIGDPYSAALMAHQIHTHPRVGYRIRGLVSTNGAPKGCTCGGIPLLAGLERVATYAASYRARDVLVIAGTLVGAQFRRLMEDCQRAELKLKVIPSMEQFVRGSQLLPVRDIDIDDLLNREPVDLDDTAIAALIRGRRVLITGAGGSIGSEICRQVVKYQPAELILLGRGENRIFAIEQELRDLGVNPALASVIVDVTDRDRLAEVFDAHCPEVVFHAAAHKHVPLMEANAGEAVKNNCFGTRIIADLADEYDVKAFVLISTDKAVNPTSVMGTTKHLAERYVQALSQHSATRFMVVRFGNVLGSAGSVVPVFQEQIRRGGPITVTDERMRRYFMTIPEASQLVLQAAAMGEGGEIFVLDMGEALRVVDLARDMIRLSGLPGDAIDIAFSGIRPGEKLYEELYFDNEHSIPTEHPKVRAARHRPCGMDTVRQQYAELESLRGHSPHILRSKLAELVPEYQLLLENPGEVTDSGEHIIAESMGDR